MTVEQEEPSNSNLVSMAKRSCKCGYKDTKQFDPSIPYVNFHCIFTDSDENKCPTCGNKLLAIETNAKTKNKEKGKSNEKEKEHKSYDELDEAIKNELQSYTHFIINHEPAKFYIANSNFNQIIRGYPGKQIRFEYGEPIDEVDKLRFSTPLINAIPIKVIKFNNGLSTDKRYKITFKANTGEIFTTQVNTIEDIIVELRGRGLIAVHREAEAALTGILNAMECDSKIESTNEVEEPGFYLDPTDKNKVLCFGLEFKQPKEVDIRECCDFINELVEKFERKSEDGKVINYRRVFPVTVLKWSINAPFDWIMKEYDKWLPWLHLGGWHSTAKNTLGKLALATWRVHDKSGHIVSFRSANTDARLGQIISQTTLPVMINEVKELNNDRYGGLVEMIKNAVDDKNARGKFAKKHFVFIPSLSAVILTGNGLPPRDGAYRTKCRPIIFTIEDMIERESKEAKEFRDWLKSKIYLLGTLGDFTVNYIMNKPEILKEKEWDDIGIEVLSEFYAKAGINIPEWINLMVEYNESVQTQDEVVLQLRGYFVNLINKATNEYRPPKPKDEYDNKDLFNQDTIPYLTLIKKLIACCDRNLIPFIRYNGKKKTFYITADIIEDLRKNKTLSDAVGSHKGLADLLNFEHKPVRTGDSKKPTKVIIVGKAQMEDFLEFKLGEVIVENEDDKTSNNTNLESDNSRDDNIKVADDVTGNQPSDETPNPPRISKKKK